MRKYTVSAAAGLTLAAGTVMGLSAAQAKPRAHALKTLQVDKRSGMGEYEAVQPVQFKCGEQIFTDAELSKRLVDSLDPVAAAEEAKK